jgi:hypothetical protein
MVDDERTAAVTHGRSEVRRRVGVYLAMARHYEQAEQRILLADRQPSNWAEQVQGCIERAQREEERAMMVAAEHGLAEATRISGC